MAYIDFVDFGHRLLYPGPLALKDQNKKEMIYSIVVKEDAYDDLQIAYDYYEEQNKGLGDKFLKEVKEKQCRIAFKIINVRNAFNRKNY